jgi:hypothetical protein
MDHVRELRLAHTHDLLSANTYLSPYRHDTYGDTACTHDVEHRHITHDMTHDGADMPRIYA